MKLIFIFGLPATGKLTVAEELAAQTGYKLLHNHLAVDLLLPVFKFGSDGFVKLREEIWLLVFAEACRSGVPGMIFTFAPERTMSASFVANAIELMKRMGGSVEFVRLECPMKELRARIGAASRHAYGKLTSVELFDELYADGAFEMKMPAAAVTVDTERCRPEEAAEEILRGVGMGV